MSGGEPPPELARFVLRFDRGEYWLSHEELEELWLRNKRDAYKGLIQVAAAFVHIGRSNWRGARAKLEQALERLERSGDGRGDIDLDQLRERVRHLLDHVRDLERERLEDFDESFRIELGAYFAGDLEGVELEEVELPYRVRRHREGYRLGRDPHRRD